MGQSWIDTLDRRNAEAVKAGEGYFPTAQPEAPITAADVEALVAKAKAEAKAELLEELGGHTPPEPSGDEQPPPWPQA